MDLKEKLVVFRTRQGLTQNELAGEIGVSRQTVSKWERGVAVPSTESLIALSRLYGVPLDEMANSGEASATAVAEKPDAPPGPGKRWTKIAGGAVLAACLLLVTIASIITIWSAVCKESEGPKDNIICTDDMKWEYIDPSEVQDWTGTTVTIEE